MKGKTFAALMVSAAVMTGSFAGCAKPSGAVRTDFAADSVAAETVTGSSVKVDPSSSADIREVLVPAAVKTGQKTELRIVTEGITGNPYDYEEVDVYGEFLSPSGKLSTVPAFYYTDYEMTFEEYDYTREYVMEDWYGGVKGVFDAGDETQAARGVIRVTADSATNYIAQKYVNLNGADTLADTVFFYAKRAGAAASGYSVGFYCESTGGSSSAPIPDAALGEQWRLVEIPYADFVKSGDDTLFSMTNIKFMGSAESEGSILIKDFGLSRAGKFPTVIDEFGVDAYAEYVATNRYNGYERMTRTDAAPEFRLRFNADETGEYRYRISVKTAGTLAVKYSGAFTATAGEARKGVVRVEPTLKRNFVYGDGTPFAAIGENTGWYQSADKKAYEFYDYFEHLSEVGANWARVFMLDYQFALFNYVNGTVNFDARADEAYRLDRIVEKAEQEGIYIALVFLIHGQFYEELDFQAWPSWNTNPYNVACGGYLEHPWEFFTDARARADFKKVARYIVARWGYSDHIFAWELWNEVNHLRGYRENSDDAVAWHREMANYVKSVDAFGHLVTTSLGVPNRDDPVNAVEELDYNNIHAYGFDNYASTLVDYQTYMLQKYNKPTLISEIGMGGDNAIQNFGLDPDGVYIHQAAWSGCFAGAGGGMTWWWETVDARNLYDIYRPVTTFFAETKQNFALMDSLTAENASLNVKLLSGTIPSDPGILFCGYRSDTAVYAYLYDRDYNSTRVENTVYAETTFTVAGMQDGAYSVRVCDPQTGVFAAAVTVNAANGSLSIPITRWRNDVAVLVEKI